MLDKSLRPTAVNVPNDLAAHWMPLTANRAFKKARGCSPAPRTCITSRSMAAKHHRRRRGHVVHQCRSWPGADIRCHRQQAARWTMRHPSNSAFRRPLNWRTESPISRLPASTTCSSANPAPKRPTPRSRSRWPIHEISDGQPHPPDRPQRGYHGVGFGEPLVGGIVNNRKLFGTLLAGVDHLSSTYDRETGLHQGERSTALILPTSWNVWSIFTKPTPLPPSSSNRWRDRRRSPAPKGFISAAARDHREADTNSS